MMGWISIATGFNRQRPRRIFFKRVKTVSIDNVRNDGVDINCHRFQPVEAKAIFFKRVKTVSIDNVRNDGVDINCHRFQPAEAKAIFFKRVKTVSIDNVRNAEGGYQLPAVLTGGGKGGFFLNGLKPFLLIMSGMLRVDINCHRF